MFPLHQLARAAPEVPKSGFAKRRRGPASILFSREPRPLATSVASVAERWIQELDGRFKKGFAHAWSGACSKLLRSLPNDPRNSTPTQTDERRSRVLGGREPSS